METILLRRQHRERQALRLVREALSQCELDAADADAGGDAAVRGGRGARTLEALHAKAHRAVIADPTWRVWLLIQQQEEEEQQQEGGVEWSGLLAFLSSAGSGFGGKREAEAYASLVRRRVEEEERAGRRRRFAAPALPPSPPPSRRRHRGPQALPPPAAPAAPAPTVALGPGLHSLAVDELLVIADFLPVKQRLGLLQLSKPFRAHLLNDGRLVEEITIPDWSKRAGPADMIRLLRLLPPGRVRALRIGRDTGLKDDSLSGTIFITSAHDPFAAFRERRAAAACELLALLVERGYGAGLRRLQLAEYPCWLPYASVHELLRHAPQLEALDVSCSAPLSFYDSDAPPPPSLKRLTLRSRRPWAWPLIPDDAAPDAATLEIYGATCWSYDLPTPSPALEHFRLRAGAKNFSHGLPPRWAYPRLRILDMRLEGLRNRAYLDAISTGCPALEYALLDFFLVERHAYHQPQFGASPPLRDTVRRLLSSLPRLFYVLVRDGHWDLTALPPGWETHTIPVEEAPGERPLLLEPKGVFSRPLEVQVTAEERFIVLFHPGRSPVRIGEDSAAWRWVQPKRRSMMNDYEE